MQPFDQLSLTTARLRLRPLAPADADALYRMHADPRVMRYWSTPPWADPHLAEELIKVDADALRLGQHLRLALTRRDGIDSDGAFIGTCSLFNFVEPSRRAEIGYAQVAAAWGQGFMHEALSALVAYAFGELNLHRIEADIDPRNTASAKSLVRLGFVEEGHLRERWIVAGEVSDTALFGLLRRDWQACVARP